jgi:hypothetical protein
VNVKRAVTIQIATLRYLHELEEKRKPELHLIQMDKRCGLIINFDEKCKKLA